MWPLLISWVDTQAVTPVLHAGQNELQRGDSKSQHKHKLTGRYPGRNLEAQVKRPKRHDLEKEPAATGKFILCRAGLFPVRQENKFIFEQALNLF